jgi:DNA primase
MSFNFREYVEEHFDPKPQQMNPDQVSISCINPDCDDNWRRNRKMTVNLAEKVAFCFKCGTHYDEISFIAQAEGISKFAALKIARSTAPIRTYGAHRLEEALAKLKPGPEPPPEEKVEIPACRFPPVRQIEPGTPEWDYLEKRWFGKEVIDHFGLLYSPYGPPTGEWCKDCWMKKQGKRCCPYFGRIIIPIVKDGVPISFQGRTIKDAKPKYLFPVDQPFGNELYNWDDAKKFDTIILVEGVTSLWRTWLNGYQNVAGTFGKSLKVEQERTIKAQTNVKRVIMLWDGGTLPEAYAAGMRLYPTKEVLIARLPGKLDPDECPDAPDYIEAATPIDKLDRLTVAISKLS